MGAAIRKIHLLEVLLLVTNVWWRSQAQLTYDIKVTWLDDPEYVNTVAPNENRWKTLTENSENLGLTFAGKAEFPWIVDMRVDHKNQEFYSVGNLVTSRTVFTCCRCADDLGNPSDGKATPRVYFAQMYLFEYTIQGDPGQFEENLRGGSRLIRRVVKDRRCHIQQQYYDGALVVLENEITSFPPYIVALQITFDYTSGRLPDFDLQNMAKQRRVCHVASFGRDFLNIKDHLVKDFKVKYRVYWEPFELCRTNKDRMCPNRHISDCNIGGLNPSDEGKELMCFQARARVGVVCDHDRGAPLVCDGLVFGLVILGAKADYCNDVLQVPFWVQKATMFRDWFEADRSRHPGNPRRLVGNPRSSGNMRLNPHHVLISIIVYIRFVG